MSANVQIEIDMQTAEVLRTRAAELGVTVLELVAELVALESEPVTVEDGGIDELDRRWRKVEATGPGVPQRSVVGWLRTWGTPQFKPWPNR